MKARKYLIVDTETCTLPEYKNDKNLSLTHPLIYDIGWIVTDYKGTIYSKHNYLVDEIYSDDSLFSTAYYSAKKPIYESLKKQAAISSKNWSEIWALFLSDLSNSDFICAYNASFDLKFAIPFTVKFFDKTCTKKVEKNSPFFLEKPIIDIWTFSCETFLNTFSYKKYAFENGWFSPSSLYYSSTAEKAYSYIVKNPLFEEAHLAIEDVLVESLILRHCLKRSKAAPKLTAFPMQKLGSPFTLIFEATPRSKNLPVEPLKSALSQALASTAPSSYRKRLENLWKRLSPQV